MAPKLPSVGDVPAAHAAASEFRGFVQRFDPTAEFRALWGAEFTEHAGTLDEVLTGQLQAGMARPEAPMEELL